ncbi:MAG: hypothetical protein CMK59_03460 [Proteobacteria bacterium]|nr:hypothetical protein [Pseudomonadota bacterium]
MIKKALLGLFVSSLILGCAEAFIRASLGPPPPAVQVHSRIGQLERYLVPDRNYWVPYYQQRAAAKLQPERIQISVLGGSSVHGGSVGVRTQEEFPALLDRKLSIDVNNLAAPSLDSHDLLRILDELAAFSSAAWVVYSGHNDFGNGYFLQRYKGHSSVVRAHLRAALERTQLYWLLRQRLGRTHVSNERLDPSNQFRGSGVSEARRKHIESDYLRNMERIIWKAQKAQVPLVVIIPASSVFTPPLMSCGSESAQTYFNRAQELKTTDLLKASELLIKARDLDCIPLRFPSSTANALRKLAQGRSGVWVVDAESLLPRETGLSVVRADLFSDNLHFSAAGHRAMAELLEPILKEISSK